jgi:hypothetical protein
MINFIKEIFFTDAVGEKVQRHRARLTEQEVARTESATIILKDDPPLPLLLRFVGDSEELQDYHLNPVIKDAYCEALNLIERQEHMSEDALYAFRLMHKEEGERERRIEKLRRASLR